MRAWEKRSWAASQLDGQPTGSAGEATIGRKRRSRWKNRSRWAAEEPKPLFQLPDFVKDLAGGVDLDPEDLQPSQKQ